MYGQPGFTRARPRLADGYPVTLPGTCTFHLVRLRFRHEGRGWSHGLVALVIPPLPLSVRLQHVRILLSRRRPDPRPAADRDLYLRAGASGVAPANGCEASPDERLLGMDPPTIATDTLIDLVTRNQILDPEPLWQFLAARGGAAALDPDGSEVVAELIREGRLTESQAEHRLATDVAPLVIGKYHPLACIGGFVSSVYLARHRRGSSTSVSPVRATAQFAIKILGHVQDIPPAVVERF